MNDQSLVGCSHVHNKLKEAVAEQDRVDSHFLPQDSDSQINPSKWFLQRVLVIVSYFGSFFLSCLLCEDNQVNIMFQLQ